jgi:hypothetical protein
LLAVGGIVVLSISVAVVLILMQRRKRKVRDKKFPYIVLPDSNQDDDEDTLELSEEQKTRSTDPLFSVTQDITFIHTNEKLF